MKKFGLFFLSFLWLSALPAAAETLTFSCSNWRPYTGKDLPQNGILGDLATEILKEAQLDIDIDFKPWPRVINELKSGNLDGSYCVMKTEERQKFLHFSEKPILKLANGFFRLKDNKAEYNTPADLKMLRIAALDNSSDVTHLNNLSPDTFKAQVFHNNVNGMKMLLGNRFDFIMMGRLVGETILKDNLPDAQGKVIYYKDIVTSDIYITLSQKIANADKLIQKIDQAHQSLIEKGKLNAIYARHGFHSE